MSCRSARWRTKIWQHGWNLLSFEFLALVTISVVICTTSNKHSCFYTWLFDEYNLFASGKTIFSLRLDKMEMKTKIEKRCFTFIFSFNFTFETKLDLCFEALDMACLSVFCSVLSISNTKSYAKSLSTLCARHMSWSKINFHPSEILDVIDRLLSVHNIFS